MPLHDWTELGGWESVHHYWMSELGHWLRPRLPKGYRAIIGLSPSVGIGPPPGKPDVSVRDWPSNGAMSGETDGSLGGACPAPDIEAAVSLDEQDTAVFVEYDGRLVAAIELVSPRNKDRRAAREKYLNCYLGYLSRGVHLLLVDVHPRPLKFSFADEIAAAVHLEQPPTPAPFAIAYRVGEPAGEGGRFLAVWRRPLAVGEPFPELPLPLTLELSVQTDLEATYMRAAEASYLD